VRIADCDSRIFIAAVDFELLGKSCKIQCEIVKGLNGGEDEALWWVEKRRVYVGQSEAWIKARLRQSKAVSVDEGLEGPVKFL
jgi:hypothetical protein